MEAKLQSFLELNTSNKKSTQFQSVISGKTPLVLTWQEAQLGSKKDARVQKRKTTRPYENQTTNILPTLHYFMTLIS